MEASKQQNKSRVELFDNEERVKLIEEVQQILWDLTDKKQKSKARKVIGKLKKIIDKQVNMLSGPSSGVISAAVYWSDIVKASSRRRHSRSYTSTNKTP
ncbi:hypothetical protein ACLKA6_019794 [Drosophila palustris]